MTRQVFDYSAPDRFVVGTVGMPGERTFFLQARADARITSVVLEKEQVSLLAERVDQLLDEVRRTRDLLGAIPEAADPDDVDGDPLDVPLDEEFRVGAMALGWDDGSQRVVIEAHAVVDEEPYTVPEIADDDADGPDTFRVWISPAAARAFAERARVVVAAGRPSCPFCSQPLDPSGHICPRANGYRRRG